MKRKIATILVAHVADYGRLVAEDEEETLRRMASCRTAIDGLIALADGRIFNTAGDALLAEFPSAVEAVRCAIDIQESLRTRNLAYPGSRQLSYRIGLGLGDVVERDGDLLGDGVNIAARLEGLAEIGGICISRAVHEQVVGKLTARFIDIGARHVKNIPTPVHAYLVATWEEARSDAPPKIAAAVTGAKASSQRPSAKWASAALVGAVALGTASVAFVTTQKPGGALSNATASISNAAVPVAMPPVPAPRPPISTATPAMPTTTPAPPVRRASIVVNDPDVPKRSAQSCTELAAQRGWTPSVSDIHGKRAFIETCMKGVLN